jgi:hypothetical protein
MLWLTKRFITTYDSKTFRLRSGVVFVVLSVPQRPGRLTRLDSPFQSRRKHRRGDLREKRFDVHKKRERNGVRVDVLAASAADSPPIDCAEGESKE